MSTFNKQINKQLLEEYKKTQDPKILCEIVMNNQLLAWKSAQRHNRIPAPGMTTEELYHEGITGLIEAVKRFDSELGYELSTYSVWWIDRNVKRSKLEQGDMIRFPENFTSLLVKVRRAEAEYEQLESPSITLKQYVMNKAGISAKAYDEMMKTDASCRQLASLSDLRPGDEESREIGDEISYDNQQHLMTFHQDYRDAADLCCDKDSKALLGRALQMLTSEERTVLELHFGLADGETQTFAEIGQRFGKNKSKMQTVKEQALKRLRQIFEEWNLRLEDVA